MIRFPSLIGVSAVTDSDHIDQLVEQFENQHLNTFGYQGAIGYLAHTGTHLKQPHPIAKFQRRSLQSTEQFIELTDQVANRVLSVLHIDCVDYAASGTTVDAAHSLGELKYHSVASPLQHLLKDSYKNKTCRTVQINGLVEIDDLNTLLQIMPELRVILSIGPSVVQYGMHSILDYIGDRRECITDILLDLSVGRGVTIHARETGEILARIHDVFPKLGVGAAGGIGPDNVEQVIIDVRRFSGLDSISIDSESGLRSSENDLDLTYLASYIAGAVNGIKK